VWYGQRANDLLEALARVPELPSAFKIFISSRPEKDIRVTLMSMVPYVGHDLSSGISRESVNSDISKCVQVWGKRLKQHYPDKCCSGDWPGPLERGALIDRSGGLFIWASTAMKFIEDDEVANPNQQLKILLEYTSSLPPPESPSALLDHLYSTVLDRAFTAKVAPDTLEEFRRVVSTVLFGKESTVSFWVGYPTIPGWTRSCI